MKWLALPLLGALALFPASARAHDDDDFDRYRRHERLHDRLEHREFHRYLEHRNAHRYPMTWWEHERLHNRLDRDAYRDYLRHERFHRRQDYVPYWYGYRTYLTPVPRSSFSFRFGW